VYEQLRKVIRLRVAPLMPVLLGVEMLMIDRDLPPKIVETPEMIRRRQGGIEFIDELLDITRGKFDLRREPMD
jgi:hypothetical protein